MRNIILGITLSLTTGSAAFAATTLDFDGSTGVLGQSHSYTASGLTVIASAFGTSPAQLYGKNGGIGEQGLGLTNDPSGDHEIAFEKGFIQIDVSQLLGLFHLGKIKSVSFAMDSSDGGEKWGVYGSHTGGMLSNSPLQIGSDELLHVLPSFGNYDFYDFLEIGKHSGTASNVLLHGLTVSQNALPEPGSWAMMLVGFGVVGFALRARGERSVPVSYG